MLSVQQFDSASDLAKYVNDNTILQTNVIRILEVDGRWWLFYWTP